MGELGFDLQGLSGLALGGVAQIPAVPARGAGPCGAVINIVGAAPQVDRAGLLGLHGHDPGGVLLSPAHILQGDGLGLVAVDGDCGLRQLGFFKKTHNKIFNLLRAPLTGVGIPGTEYKQQSKRQGQGQKQRHGQPVGLPVVMPADTVGQQEQDGCKQDQAQIFLGGNRIL